MNFSHSKNKKLSAKENTGCPATINYNFRLKCGVAKIISMLTHTRTKGIISDLAEEKKSIFLKLPDL